MKRILPALALLTLISCILAGCGNQGKSSQAKDTYSPKFQAPNVQSGLVFNDKELQFQMLRALGASAYGASDIRECMVAAMQVDEGLLAQGDFDSWYNAWNSTAERLNKIADDCLARGDNASARDTYLRCETYYRMAEFYLHGNPSDPRIRETAGKARECFRKAGKLFDPPVEEVKIKYANTTLPGYFYRVDEGGKKRPLVIIQTGFDGTQEELYAGVVAAALQRGYNCLTFEGPGQGKVLREQHLYFRQDWEKVVTPVVNYAVSRKDVDPKKVAVWGISMGGYLTTRAAAFEHRPSALIADPGMDMSDMLITKFGHVIAGMSGDPDFKADRESIRSFIEQNSRAFDQAIYGAMKGQIGLTWFFQNGMFSFGVKTPSEFLLKTLDYSLDGIPGRIKCTTLVCDSEQDEKDNGQAAKDIFEALRCEKKYVLFTNAEGAGAHCQMGASRFGNQVKLDWLEGALGGEP